MYSRVRFDEFDKYLSSNVPQKLCNTTWVISYTWKQNIQQIYPACGLKSSSPLTLYVLSNEGVVHYVTVICFQDFLKFSDVIVLVGAGMKNQWVLLNYVHCVSMTHAKTLIRIAVKTFLNIIIFVNTILTTVLGVLYWFLVYLFKIVDIYLESEQSQTS